MTILTTIQTAKGNQEGILLTLTSHALSTTSLLVAQTSNLEGYVSIVSLLLNASVPAKYYPKVLNNCQGLNIVSFTVSTPKGIIDLEAIAFDDISLFLQRVKQVKNSMFVRIHLELWGENNLTYSQFLEDNIQRSQAAMNWVRSTLDISSKVSVVTGNFVQGGVLALINNSLTPTHSFQAFAQMFKDDLTSMAIKNHFKYLVDIKKPVFSKTTKALISVSLVVLAGTMVWAANQPKARVNNDCVVACSK